MNILYLDLSRARNWSFRKGNLAHHVFVVGRQAKIWCNLTMEVLITNLRKHRIEFILLCCSVLFNLFDLVRNRSTAALIRLVLKKMLLIQWNITYQKLFNSIGHVTKIKKKINSNKRRYLPIYEFIQIGLQFNLLTYAFVLFDSEALLAHLSNKCSDFVSEIQLLWLGRILCSGQHNNRLFELTLIEQNLAEKEVSPNEIDKNEI